MKRYTIEGFNGLLDGPCIEEETEAGEWVKHEDAIAAIKAERERCARLCETHSKNMEVLIYQFIDEEQCRAHAMDCATVIRSAPGDIEAADNKTASA